MDLSRGHVIHETKDFQVEIGKLELLPEPYRGVIGYRMRNKRTQVIEKEGTSEGEALIAMHDNQDYLTKALANPTSQTGPQTGSDLLSVLPAEGNA